MPNLWRNILRGNTRRLSEAERRVLLRVNLAFGVLFLFTLTGGIWFYYHTERAELAARRAKDQMYESEKIKKEGIERYYHSVVEEDPRHTTTTTSESWGAVVAKGGHPLILRRPYPIETALRLAIGKPDLVTPDGTLIWQYRWPDLEVEKKQEAFEAKFAEDGGLASVKMFYGLYDPNSFIFVGRRPNDYFARGKAAVHTGDNRSH